MQVCNLLACYLDRRRLPDIFSRLHGTLTWVANLITKEFPEGNNLLHSLVPHSVVYELMLAAMTLSFRPFAVETKLSILSIFLFDQWKTRRCLTSW